jgi:DNA polymerase III subunit gamma/tau
MENIPYRVLARKYRPSSFEDLIGQEPMVKTLSNSFNSNRIAQAWLLTGVRGVGKTTTARILARGLNYKTNEIDRPTIDMPILGEHCTAIMESRHVDVIEMDAASNTGINDIREIIESARYRPASARYKVFIIDEVHMLSTAAFNGLLKTLEEPPPHVKFVFATTEIRKVPITILSRCQRFDLRRIEQSVLINHLKGILNKENLSFEDEALALLARASEGSVRDSLSLTDQAIASGAGQVSVETVQAMLGLADKNKLISLFESLIQGDFKTALAALRDLYDLGADPASILSELADFTHFVTRLKLIPESGEGDEVSLKRGLEFASILSLRVLSRLFALFIKGLEEVKASPKPLHSAEMVLIRLCHASDLPSPEETIKAFQEAQANGLPAPRVVSSTPLPQARSNLALKAEPQSSVALNTLEDIVTLARDHKEGLLTVALQQDVRLVSLAQGHLEIALLDHAAPSLPQEIARKLKLWTGQTWLVTLSSANAKPTLAQQQQTQKQALLDEVKTDPLVRAALEMFKGAKIIGVYDTLTPAAASSLQESGDNEVLNDVLAAVEEED